MQLLVAAQQFQEAVVRHFDLLHHAVQSDPAPEVDFADQVCWI
jgi:hypothetical protein